MVDQISYRIALDAAMAGSLGETEGWMTHRWLRASYNSGAPHLSSTPQGESLGLPMRLRKRHSLRQLMALGICRQLLKGTERLLSRRREGNDFGTKEKHWLPMLIKTIPLLSL